jgi:TPR repeat protein
MLNRLSARNRLGSLLRHLVAALALCTAIPAIAQEAAAVTREAIVAALRSGDLAALDARLNALQGAFDADPRAEGALVDAFAAFRGLPAGYATAAQDLDAWVERYPKSYAALLARGTYAIQRGMRARGEKWSRDTPREAFEEMEGWFDRGRRDLDASLTLAARPLLSYLELIGAAMRSGWREDLERHYAAAEALAPRSITLRVLYMQHLQPRWGGSYQAMEDFARRSAAALGPGPDLDRLKAMIPADRASAAERNDFPRAEALYSEAIALADRARYRCGRAWVRMKQQRTAEAVADIVAAAKVRQGVSYCHNTAAWIGRENWQTPGILEALDEFLQEDPDHAAMLNQRGWIRQQRGDLTSAFVDYRRAAELGDAWAETMTGKFLFSGWGGVSADREKGLEWLRRAAEKGEPNAQLSVVQALEAMGRRDEAAREKARYAALGRGRGAGREGPAAAIEDERVSTVNLVLAGAALLLLVALFLVLRAGRRA